MDDSWACSAAYVYALHLDPSARAWEYLRRNPRYARDWMRYRRSPSHRIAARWGLEALVDPRLDARQVSPVWTMRASPEISLVRDEMPQVEERQAAPDLFSFWRIAGSKSLFRDGRGVRLVVCSSAKAVQLRLGGGLSEGDRFAYQIPAGAADCAAWTALSGFRALMPVSRDREASLSVRPGRVDIFHARALQVLDGLAAGASQRELGGGIFGAAAVARGWQPDGALRAQVRYLIRRARALVEEEYRSLVGAGSVDSRSRSEIR